MDEQRARIEEDLRGLLDGDVRADDVFLQLYASDASIYEIKPLAIVLPRSTADVAACVRYAAANQLPIHARGAGTGLAGESLGPGIVLDFSKHLRRILATSDESVQVQPGLVLERLNAYLRAFGRHFGPDPANSQVTTLGSVVALNASGSHWLKHGATDRHIEQLQIVLADGEILEVGCEPLVEGVSYDPQPRKRALVNELTALFAREADTIKKHQPKTKVNRAGYALPGILEGDHLNLARLLCGSEGTLALITEAKLHTTALARNRGVALLFFNSLEGASKAVLDILPLGPTACDLMDRRHIGLAREAEPRFDVLIPPAAEALLLVEQEGNDTAEVRERLRGVIAKVRQKKALAFDSRQAYDPDEIDLYWQLAQEVVPTLQRLRGLTRALPGIEDMAVPPETLPSFLVQIQNVLKRHHVTASLFAHAGHGQLHLRPFLDPSNPDDVQTLQCVAGDLYDALFAVGGTISGEHGDGLSRTSFLPQQYGELYGVFREVKRIFDPNNTLNPGKVVGDDPELMTRNVRPMAAHISHAAPTEPVSANGNALAATGPLLPIVEMQLEWSREDVAQMADRCNGCGTCRALGPEVRMCPIFRFAPAEEASPRAKANLMRGVLSGQMDPALLATDEFKGVADLCVNCQMCRLECPANVDIPRLMVEAKAAYVSANGLGVREWWMSRIDLLSSFASLLYPLTNWAIGNRQARWFLEKVLGLAQGRKLPRAASQTFMRRARRRRLTRPSRRAGAKVAYFVDTYANYYDPELAESLVSVFEHNAITVFVHPAQKASGMAMISVGAVDGARKQAAHNVRILAEAVRQGYHIVTTEPSAALALTREYPALLDDDDVRLVAENTSEACTYLWRLHRAGKLLLDFLPVHATAGYHTPCHLKALQVGTPGEQLLRLIPGLRVQRLEAGCSGMAGTFGLKRENYRSSLRAGWGLITGLRQPGLHLGTTECSTCKMQMEQGTSKPTIHPLKLLALSYGLKPELATLMNRRGEELVVT